MKKKTMMIGIFVLGMLVTSAVPSLAFEHLSNKNTVNAGNTFEGVFGPKPHGNITVGTFSGTYELRGRGGRFTGEWDLSFQNKTASGTIKGIFAKHFVIGRITIAETNKRVPIVGFLRTNNETMVGRIMAPVGPALYYWGSFN